MKGNQVILAVFCCFVLFSVVNTDSIEGEPLSVSTAVPVEAERSYSAVSEYDYKEQVFVDVDATHYYKATIYNKNDKIKIKIINEQV